MLQAEVNVKSIWTDFSRTHRGAPAFMQLADSAVRAKEFQDHLAHLKATALESISPCY